MDIQTKRMDALVQQVAGMSEAAAFDPVLTLQVERLKARMSDPLYKVVVAGHFSSGKSTFLNALMGAKVLISRSGETTSCATRVFPVPPEHELAYSLRIHYRDGQTVTSKLTDRDSILLDTTTLHGKQERHSDIRLVEIFHPLPVEAGQICFVDTPGGNGMTPHLFDATREEIQAASAIVFMMSDRGITAYDSDLIEYIRKYQERVFFVVNQMDRVSPEEREELLGAVASNLQTIFSLGEAPEVWGLSSSQALEARLSGNAKLLSDSGFASFEQQLTDYFTQADFVEDYVNNLEKAIAEISSEIAEQQAQVTRKLQQQQELVDLQAKRKLIQIRGKFRELEHNVRDYIELDTSQLLDDLDEKKKEWVTSVYQPFSRQILAGTEKLSTELRSIYHEHGEDIAVLFEKIESRINRYDVEIDERFGHAFTSFTHMIDSDLGVMSAAIPKRNKELIELLLQFHLDTSQTQQPFEKLIESLQVHSFSFKPIALGDYREQLMLLRQMHSQIVKLEKEETKVLSAIPAIERNLESKNKNMSAMPAEYKRNVDREGPMPSVERWTEEIEVERKSIFGLGLRDMFLGKKKKEVTRTDDSKQRQWKAKLQDLENRYQATQDQLNGEALELRNKIDTSKQMAVQLKRQVNQVRQQVDEKVLEDIIPGLQRSYRHHANLINAQAKQYLEQAAIHTVMECQNALQQDRAVITDMICTQIKTNQDTEEQHFLEAASSTRISKEEHRS